MTFNCIGISVGCPLDALEIAATVDGVKVSLPLGLKKMGRIIEKTILKRKDDPGNADKVCDIVRGMVECTNMSQIAAKTSISSPHPILDLTSLVPLLLLFF